MHVSGSCVRSHTVGGLKGFYGLRLRCAGFVGGRSSLAGFAQVASAGRGHGSGELALDDLAGRGQRERVDELHEAWVLIARELRLAPGDELVLGGGVAGLLDDDRLDLLTVRLVRDAD